MSRASFNGWLPNQTLGNKDNYYNPAAGTGLSVNVPLRRADPMPESPNLSVRTAGGAARKTVRKPVAKKTTSVRKTVAKKPTAAAKKTTTVRKAVAKKPAAKKTTVAKKTVTKKKPAAKKPAAKKTTAKK